MALFNNKYPYTDFHELNLDWMIEAVSNVQSSIDMFDETVQELKKELSNIQGIYPRIESLEASISLLKSEYSSIESKLNEVDNREKADIIELRKMITALENTVNNVVVKFNSIFTYIDSNLDKLELLITEKYHQSIEEIKTVEYNCNEQIEAIKSRLDNIDTSVYNSWHSADGRVDQDKNNKFIYSDLADQVPTAREYASLGLSADDYATFNAKAINYSKFGKKILHLDFVFNPITGYKQDINNILTSIVNHFSNTLTADEFSALDLSADDYTALDLTALSYYSYKN